MRTPRRFEDGGEASPLSLPWIHILLALAEGSRHGYAIMQDVDQRTDGVVKLWPATLYGAIKRMLAAGLIDGVAAPPSERDARRRYYGLTPLGRQVLERETARLARLVASAKDRNVLGREPSR